MQAIMLNLMLSLEVKGQMLQRYQQQGQPIVVPYGTGEVLVQPIVFSNIFRDKIAVFQTSETIHGGLTPANKMKTRPKLWRLLSIAILLIGISGNACFAETQAPLPSKR